MYGGRSWGGWGRETAYSCDCGGGEKERGDLDEPNVNEGDDASMADEPQDAGPSEATVEGSSDEEKDD